jgi:tRNA-modifying protein YgfZ
MIIEAMTTSLEGLAPLSHLGVLRAKGPDALRFLHGQLTQDFLLLDEETARLAAFCSAKGRMQASFIGLKLATDEVLLIGSRDLLPGVRQRLSLFILRAQVQLSDASTDWALWGLAGSAAAGLGLSPQSPPWQRVRQDGRIGIQLYPAAGVQRVLCVQPADMARPAGADCPLALWQWGEVQSGVATLPQALVDAFVPQMLNYESVGGVNFKKGCYPGQEVVARSQFRGTLKRRTFIVHAETALSVAAPIFGVTSDSEPCGQIVQAALHPDGGWDALACLQIGSAQDALHLGSAQGQPLTLRPLPYPLLQDI